MIEMAAREILPAVNAYAAEVAAGASAKIALVPSADISMETELVERLSGLCSKAFEKVKELKQTDAAATKKQTAKEKATAFARRVIPVMNDLRALVDEAETLTSCEYWPMPNYGDMMFRV